MSDSDGFGGLAAQLLGFFGDWLFAALHPLETCRSLLASTSDQARFDQGAKLWLASFLISVVINLPIYHQHGIELSTVEFHLVNLLLLTAAILACGLIFHVGLRMYGVKSIPSDTITMYAAYFVNYQPIAALYSYFANLRFFNILGAAKSRGAGFGSALEILLLHSRASLESTTIVNVGALLSSWLGLITVLMSSTLMANTVARTYSVSRSKSFAAVAFITTVLLLPVFLVEAGVSAYLAFTFSR